MAKKSQPTFPYTTNPDEIPTKKIVKVGGECAGRVFYQCPDHLWTEHFRTWQKHRQHNREGSELYPEPMHWGHCMFESPRSYACIPYGCTDQAEIRAAHEVNVRALLDGWDRELKKTPEGQERFEKIVKATVDARMDGNDVGASPFVACIYAGLA